MKIVIGLLLLLGGLSFAISRGVVRFNASWEYENKISNYWDLADKASTITQKAAYINAFVSALEKADLKDVNANLFRETPASGFNQNFIALKSLQVRLRQISSMDENSFACQTAIQQITEQEQGQACDMLGVFEDCWYRINHYTLWHPVYLVGFILLQALLIIVGGVVLFSDDY